jgi:hypothetical protein
MNRVLLRRRFGFALLTVLAAALLAVGILAQEPEVIFRFAAQI